MDTLRMEQVAPAPDAPVAVDPHAEVSVEVDGRVLTGVGVSEDTLHAAIDATSSEQPDPTPDPGTTPEAASERLSRGQRRFQKLNAEIEASRAEVARERAERERLAAEIEALKTRSVPAAEPVRQETRPATPPPASLPAQGSPRPRPSADDIGTTYADWNAYVQADNQWVEDRLAQATADVDARIQAALEQDRAQQSFRSRIQTVVEQGKALYPDFDTVVNSLPVVFPGPHVEAILSDADSPRLQYLLAKHPDEAASIARMTNPIEVGKAFARLLSTAPPVVSPASTGVVRPSTAPPPVQPVGSGARTTSPPLAELAEKSDFEAYKARRHADLKGVAHR